MDGGLLLIGQIAFRFDETLVKEMSAVSEEGCNDQIYGVSRGSQSDRDCHY